MNNLPYYLGFSHFLGIGPVRFDVLVNTFGGVEAAYKASLKELEHVLPARTAQEFVAFRDSFNSVDNLERYTKNSISVLTREHEQYPNSLRHIPDPPVCIYVKGNIAQFDFEKHTWLGVVGTRRATSYGRQITRQFVTELATAGVGIVSGMALGIDAEAHTACLNAGGKTIAVLGCGVDIVYPQENRKLYERIINSGGLIVSEFPPGMQVRRGLFVSRNRLISGLSRGVWVAEGQKTSGALITARNAAEQGRDVFACPGLVTSPAAEGPHMLIREGAHFTIAPQDILDEFNLSSRPKMKEDLSHLLTTEEEAIYKIIVVEPQGSDDIARSLNMPVAQVLSLLTTMEIKGVVQRDGGRFVVVL